MTQRFADAYSADAQQANLGFVISQTSHIESNVYRIKYPELDYASIVPVDTSARDFAKTVTYFSMDKAGEAKFMNGNSSDVPYAESSMEKFETGVHTAGIGYRYGYEDVNQARELGINLAAEAASAARRASEQLIYDATLLGNAEKNFEGLFDYTGVPRVALADTWANLTPDQILASVNDLITGVHVATNTTAIADTLLLPFQRLNTIASQRIPDTNITIYEFLKANNVYTANTGQPLTIRGYRDLDTAGQGGVARMVAYRRSPEVLKVHIPMPHRFLPLQTMGLEYRVPGIFRFGGLDIRLPQEVRYGDGL